MLPPKQYDNAAKFWKINDELNTVFVSSKKSVYETMVDRLAYD